MRHRIRWIFTIDGFDIELSGEGEIEGRSVKVFDPRISIEEKAGKMYVEMGLETFVAIADVVQGWIEKLIEAEMKA